MQATASQFASLNSPLSGFVNALNFLKQGKKTSVYDDIAKGMNMMMNGLAIILASSEKILNEKIDFIMDNEKSVINR